MISNKICKKAGDAAIMVLVVVFILTVIAWLGEVVFLLYQKDFRGAFLAFVVPPVILISIIGAGQKIDP